MRRAAGSRPYPDTDGDARFWDEGLESEVTGMLIDYSGVTELAGGRASGEQLSRLYHRYRSAASYCESKDVLEVGCGAGQGLGYLAKRAREVIGGDYTHTNLLHARRHYQGRVKLVRLDAHHLPFPDNSFDVVILFEAIYYLASPEKFFDESHRVLRSDGLLLICTVNRDWPDFHASPFSVRYFSAPELVATLREKAFEVELFGAYLVSTGPAKDRVVSSIKRMAVALRLMPKTLRQREILKRVFFGKLKAVPPEIEEDLAEYTPLVPISPERPNFQYKVLYALGRAR